MSKYNLLNFGLAFLFAWVCFSAFSNHAHAQFVVDPYAPSHDASFGTETHYGTPAACVPPQSCGSACYSNSCCDSTGLLYGRADAVFWTLGGSKRPLILREVNRNTIFETALTANDLSSTRGTPRILLGLNLNPCLAIEGQYNGFSPWKSSRTLTGNIDLWLPGSLGAASDDYFAADQMIVRNETTFHSAELNFVRKVKQTQLSTLAGFRYINFEEKFGLNSTKDISVPNYSSDYLVHAKNDLYGGQLGLKWNPEITDRFGLNFVGKAGVYGNNARQTTWVGDDNNTYVHRDHISMKKKGTAFVGELNLGGYYRMTESLSFVGGYNLMWVGNTARAADQLDFTFTTESSHFVATDTLFMHGANVGLEWNF